MAVVKDAPSPAPAAAKIEVENPATGEIIAEVPAMNAAQVAELCATARAAQPGWEALGFEGRAAIFRRCQKWVIDNADRVIETIVSETGKTWEDAQLAEVGYVGPAFGFWADMAPKYLADERIRTRSVLNKGKKLAVRYAPVGVVGVIGPWNYPLSNSFGDCIPALAAGNAVVLKPSEVTPLSSLMMEEMLHECGLPEGVFNVATGYGDTGAALIDEVDFVMFTGSTATGKKVMAKAAETLTPVSLELGGKDPMIICADADLERAANSAVYYSMQNAGQTCISTERVYVEEPVYDEFVNKVVDKVRELRMGVSSAPRDGRGRRDHPPAPVGHHRGARQGRRRQGCARAHRRQAPRRARPLLRADRARGRRPLDGLHARGDLRPDPADHEGAATRRRRCGWQTTRRTDSRRRSTPRTRPRASGWPARIEAGAVTVNDAQLNYVALGAADGRLEDIRPGHPPRLGRASASTRSSRPCS